MKLPFDLNFGKEKVARRPSFAEKYRLDLQKHLYNYGLDLDPFAARVRRFLKESVQHHDRLIFRDAIAGCWGLDMASDSDRDALWRRVAEERNVRRETGNEWVTGEADPPPDELRSRASIT